MVDGQNRVLHSYIIKSTLVLFFLLKKNVRIFCSAKDSHIFSTKNISVFVIFTFENLTKR